MRQVTRQTVRADAMAALTNAAIVMPQGVAFALVAGLPPEYGLFTAMITAIVAGFWGSSMVMVSGPTTAISALMFATLSPIAPPESQLYIVLALTLTIMIGMLQVAAGVARLGGLISFISHSVIVGFTAAAALLIACSQLGPALGVEVERGGSVIQRLLRIGEQIDHINPTACIIAFVTLFSIVLCQRLSRHLPAYLVALAVGAGAGHLLQAEENGIAMFSALSSVLPSFHVPAPTIGQIVELIPGAIAIAVVGLLEAISIGRAFATRREEKYDSNQEIVGQGLSNTFGGFLSCYAGSGSFTRSGLNAESGAQTPMSAIFAAAWLFLLLLLLAPLVVYIPVPAMAGIILYVAWRLIKISEIGHILQSSSETAILVATFLVGVIVDLEYAIVVGVVLSLVFFLYASSHPFVGVTAPMMVNGVQRLRNAEHNDLPQCPRISIRRIQGQIFFGSVDELERDFAKISQDRPSRNISVLILQGIQTVDLAGADFLNQHIRRTRRHGGQVFIVALYPSLITALERFGTMALLGEENLFHSKREAISHAIASVPNADCAGCLKRVFTECADKPGAACAERQTPAQA
ncbi:SulP family inorganic anion transporter [Pacificoceanicola onchidii]|uniref:SulP family inorganic anion transporter n=1 Tax=Pacificoceanicola onchidii TaxID=2562685 RepID=UPI0010A2DD01|nr:SulP family inorganic anion transporter [Pacificoceanicola onchidii]